MTEDMRYCTDCQRDVTNAQHFEYGPHYDRVICLKCYFKRGKTFVPKNRKTDWNARIPEQALSNLLKPCRRCHIGQINLEINGIDHSLICSERASGIASHMWIEIMPSDKDNKLTESIREKYFWGDAVTRLKPEQLAEYILEVMKIENPIDDGSD